jgi:ribosomal protein S2
MKKFIFTNKGSDEVIGMSEHPKTLQKAIEFFAKIKNLSTNDFIRIYEVKEK